MLSTRSENTRLKLLEAGRKAFSEQGLEGARVEAIAKEAGVNKALINYHFRGKQGLYRELLRDSFRRAAGSMAKDLAGTAAGESRLRAWPQALARALRDDPRLSALFLREIMEGGGSLTGEAGSAAAELADSLAQALREEDGIGTDPQLLYLLLSGSLMLADLAAAWQMTISGEKAPRSEIKADSPKDPVDGMLLLLEELIDSLLRPKKRLPPTDDPESSPAGG